MGINVLKNLKRFMPGKPTLIIISAVLVVVVLVSTRPSNAPEVREERAWSVYVIEANPQTLSPTLELFGEVQSPQNAELSAGIEALVVSMPVRDGSSVEAGDVLLVLDDRDATLELRQYEADLKEAQAQLNIANIRLKRSKESFGREQELLVINASRTDRANELAAEGLLSQSDLDTAKENLARQQIALNQSELDVEENSAKLIELDARIARFTALRDAAAIDLERTRVRAPFPGVISDLQVSEGDRVRYGDALMRLQNPASIEIRAQLPSRVARAIGDRVGAGTTIRANVQVDGNTLPGKLLRVSGQTSAGSGGVDSFIGLEDNATGMRLGSTVRVVMELPPEANVVAVPGEAVYGNNRLYKLTSSEDDGRMQMIEFNRIGERELAGSRGGTEILVRSPMLKAGDKIIVTKLANAADGLLVKAQPLVGDRPSTALSSNGTDTGSQVR